MIWHSSLAFGGLRAPEPVKVGRPHRDRAKVKACRRAARRNR